MSAAGAFNSPDTGPEDSCGTELSKMILATIGSVEEPNGYILADSMFQARHLSSRTMMASPDSIHDLSKDLNLERRHVPLESFHL